MCQLAAHKRLLSTCAAKVESNERDFLDEERSHSTSVIIEEGGDNGEFDFCISALVWIEHEVSLGWEMT